MRGERRCSDFRLGERTASNLDETAWKAMTYGQADGHFGFLSEHLAKLRGRVLATGSIHGPEPARLRPRPAVVWAVSGGPS